MAGQERTIVYVSCAETREILRFGMDRTSGALTLISSTPVPGTDKPSPVSIPLAFSPDRTKLYAGVRAEPFPLSSFAVDPHDGALTLLGIGHLSHTTAYISVDATGRHLLAASVQGNVVTSQPIDEDGVARGPVTCTVPDMGFAHCVIIDRAGLNVYVATRDMAAVKTLNYQIPPTANKPVTPPHWPADTGGFIAHLKLDPASGNLGNLDLIPAPAGGGPRHMKLARGERTLYLLNELDASITVYDVDAATGSLRQAQQLLTHPVGEDALAADIHLTPDERFLYASERFGNTLMCFTVDAATGTLTQFASVPTEDWTRSFAIDPRGRFLYAAGQNSNHVAIFAINAATGALTQIARIPTPQNPAWVEILDF